MPFNLGAGEVLVVLLVALLVLGPDKLPQAARNVGKAMSEVRRVTSGFQAELRDALQEPVSGTPRQATDLRAPTPPPPSPPPPASGASSGADAAGEPAPGAVNGSARPDGDGSTASGG